MRFLYELSWLWETLGIALAAAAVCIACGCGCLYSLRRTDLQGSEEETQQKGVGSHRSSGICGRDSGGHSDRPDADAALTGRIHRAMRSTQYRGMGRHDGLG